MHSPYRITLFARLRHLIFSSEVIPGTYLITALPSFLFALMLQCIYFFGSYSRKLLDGIKLAFVRLFLFFCSILTFLLHLLFISSEVIFKHQSAGQVNSKSLIAHCPRKWIYFFGSYFDHIHLVSGETDKTTIYRAAPIYFFGSYFPILSLSYILHIQAFFTGVQLIYFFGSYFFILAVCRNRNFQPFFTGVQPIYFFGSYFPILVLYKPCHISSVIRSTQADYFFGSYSGSFECRNSVMMLSAPC